MIVLWVVAIVVGGLVAISAMGMLFAWGIHKSEARSLPPIPRTPLPTVAETKRMGGTVTVSQATAQDANAWLHAGVGGAGGQATMPYGQMAVPAVSGFHYKNRKGEIEKVVHEERGVALLASGRTVDRVTGRFHGPKGSPSLYDLVELVPGCGQPGCFGVCQACHPGVT